MEIELLPKLSGYKRDAWVRLLRLSGLEPDEQLDSTLLIWDGDAVIATGSRSENVLKCIAVDTAHQGQDLTATVLTHLRQDALQTGHRHLFLYTKPQNKHLFSSLFFYPVAETDAVLLMEDKPHGIGDFLESLPAPTTQGNIGAVVMNCNPFTLGHRYLIETAAKDCCHLYVFVLSEDRSHFRTADRMAMVQAGTADLSNVTVLPTGPYLISAATFPTYFLKDRSAAQSVQCHLDTAVFAEHYVPRFGIKCRYVGSEPLCNATAQYNRVMHDLLPKYGISLHEIPRIEDSNAPISASAVRALLKEGSTKKLRSMVPETTYRYLQEHDLF